MRSTNTPERKQKLVATGPDGAFVNLGRRHSVKLNADVANYYALHKSQA